MAAQSTLRVMVVRNRPCHAFLHTYTRSCLAFYLRALRRSSTSTLSVFGTLYGLPVLVKMLKTGLDLNEVREYLTSTFWTTSYISLHLSLSLGFSCVFRALLGYYTQYTAAFIPTMVASLCFLLEDANKRNIAMFMYGNTMLERMLLLSARATNVSLTPAVITLVFMASSGVLLYLLRRPDFRSLLHRSDNPWFFYPPPMKDKDHKDDVSYTLLHNLKSSAWLLAAGVAVQVARVAVRSALRPAAIAAQLRRFATFRLGLFLSGYSALYQVCSWALERARGRDAAWHAAPAGLLAGAALYLYPQRTVALMAATTTLQILMKWFCKKIDAKNITFWKLLFVCFTTAHLVHFYFIDPDCCPSWFQASFDSMSGGISAEIRTEAFKAWHPYLFPVVVAGI